MVFDVNMYFTRKARHITGGHQTDPTDSITYTLLFSRESMRLEFRSVVLKNLDVLADDIGNAYLNYYWFEMFLFVDGYFLVVKRAERWWLLDPCMDLNRSDHLEETIWIRKWWTWDSYILEMNQMCVLKKKIYRWYWVLVVFLVIWLWHASGFTFPIYDHGCFGKVI